MEKFTIRIASLKKVFLLYIVYLLSVVSVYFALFMFFGKDFINNIFVLIFISIIGLSMFYYTNKLCSKISIFCLEDEKITIEYSSFFRKVNKLEIRFEDIKNYLFQKDQYFNVFRIYQKNKKSLKLFMFNSDLENESKFLEFYSNFEARILKENADRLDHQKIERKATIYESKVGLFSAVFILIILIVLPIIYVFSDKKINIGSLLLLYSSGSFFIYKVYTAHKK